MPTNSNDIDRQLARKRLERRLERHESMRQGQRLPTRQEHQSGFMQIASSLLETYGIKALVVVVAAVFLIFMLLGALTRCVGARTDEPSSSPARSESSVEQNAGNARTEESERAQAEEPNSAGTQTQTQTQTTTTPASSTAPTHTLVFSENGPRIVDVLARRFSEQAAKQHETTEEVLSTILEEDLVTQLMNKTGINANVSWIATHPESYATDGWAVQHKILKLAAEEDAASDYVRAWPDEYPAYDQNLSSSIAIQTKPTGPKEVPLLYQWDPRWGYTVYSSTSFGMTGCCPTAFAMVYQGVTGKTDMTPYDMGKLAEELGYMSLYEGTDAYFVINEAQGLGMNCYWLGDDAASLVAALEDGQVVIVNVGPGDFTDDGHFIVATGLKDGKVIVNDPYSKIRSEKLWDPQEIVDQAMLMLGYTAA